MDRPKQLPRPVFVQSDVHQSVKYEQRQRSTHKEQSLLAAMSAFIGAGGFFGAIDEMFGRHVEKVGRRGFVASRASVEQLVRPMRKFYSQRPRPWCSPNARARLMRKARRRDAERRAA